EIAGMNQQDFIATVYEDNDGRCQLRPHLFSAIGTTLGNVGVQYKLFKPFSLYLEPNMFYYFRNSSNIETYRTEHPFIITVPFGLRLTW
ncbi:MAG: hypothetical protein ACFNOO_04420, partial [Segatella oulorum]